MKKVIIICITIFTVFIGTLFSIWYFNRVKLLNRVKRYEEIRESVKKEAIEYLTLTESLDRKEEYLYDDDITNPLYRGADKNILLDIDNKSYCKAAIYGYVKDDKWNADVYIKCKNYSDEEYENTIEWLKCKRVIKTEYYETNFEDFVCPEYKRKYLNNN